MAKNSLMKIFVIFSILLFAVSSYAYKIGEGDTLKITVINVPEITNTYVVNLEGNIVLPFAGNIPAAGRTASELLSDIKSKLAKRINSPEVYLDIIVPTNNVVYVNGLVKSPGATPIKNGFRLSNIITAAGDVNIDSRANLQLNDIVFNIISNDKSVEVLYKDLLTSDYIPKNGDIINVAAPSDVVFVTGLVKNPGSVIIKRGWKLSNIITFAGDIAASTKDNMPVSDDIVFKITTLSGKSSEVLYKDLISNNYIPQNGDIIKAEINGKINVNVVGKVNLPGRYVLSNKNDSLMSAIVLAGGFTSDADYSKVTVFDIDGRGVSMSLSNLLDGSAKGEMYKIKDNSTIIVPELISGVTVLGWVNTPGKQIFKPDEVITLADVIARAGGGVKNKARYAQVAVISNVNGVVTRKTYDFNSYQKKGVATENPVVKNGDVVFVPASSSIDWSVVVSALSSLVTFGSNINNFNN